MRMPRNLSMVLFIILLYFFVSLCFAEPCEVSEWTEWTACSTTCTGGTQSRSRTIVVDGEFCPSNLLETRSCNNDVNCTGPCILSAWSPWSSCSSSCQGGVQQRTRTVEQAGSSCPNNLMETRLCNTGVVCAPCESSCFQATATEVGSSAWCNCCRFAGECGNQHAGPVNRTVCLDRGFCSSVCTEHSACTEPLDCVVSPNYSPWSIDCFSRDVPISNATCGMNSTRTRDVLRWPVAGGQPCPARTETRPCPCATTDCAGTIDGSLALDLCDVCGGDSSSCLDCTGLPNGPYVYDECDVCAGDGSTCADCQNVPNGPATMDQCGVCNGNGTTCTPYDFKTPAPTPLPPGAVECVVGNWSAWSPCSKSCRDSIVPGTRTRTRPLISPSVGLAPACPPLTETEKCNENELCAVCNCVGCNLLGHPVGSDVWCRCCTQDRDGCDCETNDNVYQYAGWRTKGFCSDQCLGASIPDHHGNFSLVCEPEPVVNCVWSGWSPWTGCGGGGARDCTSPALNETRTRTILVRPRGLGATACPDILVEFRPCPTLPPCSTASTAAAPTQPTPDPPPPPPPVNCQGCAFSPVVGSEAWCRCCSLSSQCPGSVFVQRDCIVDNGFCITTCLTSNGTASPLYCENIDFPPPPTATPLPLPTTPVSTDSTTTTTPSSIHQSKYVSSVNDISSTSSNFYSATTSTWTTKGSGHEEEDEIDKEGTNALPPKQTTTVTFSSSSSQGQTMEEMVVADKSNGGDGSLSTTLTIGMVLLFLCCLVLCVGAIIYCRVTGKSPRHVLQRRKKNHDVPMYAHGGGGSSSSNTNQYTDGSIFVDDLEPVDSAFDPYNLVTPRGDRDNEANGNNSVADTRREQERELRQKKRLQKLASGRRANEDDDNADADDDDESFDFADIHGHSRRSSSVLGLHGNQSKAAASVTAAAAELRRKQEQQQHNQPRVPKRIVRGQERSPRTLAPHSLENEDAIAAGIRPELGALRPPPGSRARHKLDKRRK